MSAPAHAKQSTCSAAVLEAIYGKSDAAAKTKAYDASLGNWWHEYASRKNDEEEEHVADSLLYDERCHLPRMAPKPDVVVAAGAEKSKAETSSESGKP
jgi:hypothetical protein